MVCVLSVIESTHTASSEDRLQATAASVDQVLEQLRASHQAARAASTGQDPRRTSFIWISLDHASTSEIDAVAEQLGLDDLLLEDALSPQQRAKIEIRPDDMFMIVKTLQWLPRTSDVETGQVAVFIGPGYAVTRSSGPGLDLEQVQRRLHENPELRDTGPLSVAWAVADLAVDGYITVGEAIQVDIEQIEEAVFSDLPADVATRIYRLNRESIEMRRAVRPLLPVAHRLTQGTMEGVPGRMRTYLSDIGDHILRANDMVDGYDTTLMTMLMASTARQDLQQNRDMRKIAAWAAIIAVPTAIAGIYGMNFDVMPELHWAFGYPTALAIMGVICLVLYRGFRRSGWV